MTGLPLRQVMTVTATVRRTAMTVTGRLELRGVHGHLTQTLLVRTPVQASAYHNICTLPDGMAPRYGGVRSRVKVRNKLMGHVKVIVVGRIGSITGKKHIAVLRCWRAARAYRACLTAVNQYS